jgi:hypothetical protein
MAQTTSIQTADEYIAQLDEPRRSDVRELHELIRREAPELEPHITSHGMIGYGRYHYRYKSGREGDWSTVGLASRKGYISLYINASGGRHEYMAESYRDRLPKADIGRSCVRIKRLSDVDVATVAELVREAAKYKGDYIEA